MIDCGERTAVCPALFANMDRNKRNKPLATQRLVLASASPRRAALMREYGYEFEVTTPPLEEPAFLPGNPAPAQQAEALAYFKARSTAERVQGAVILAADTLVALGERVFGKPTDRAHARRILQMLSGTTHDVITGVAILDTTTGDRIIRHDSTAVTMNSLTDTQLEDYLDTGAWKGKAGAYGIQDHGDEFVVRVSGSFTNVVGLPMELVSDLLGTLGFETGRP